MRQQIQQEMLNAGLQASQVARCQPMPQSHRACLQHCRPPGANPSSEKAAQTFQPKAKGWRPLSFQAAAITRAANQVLQQDPKPTHRLRNRRCAIARTGRPMSIDQSAMCTSCGPRRNPTAARPQLPAARAIVILALKKSSSRKLQRQQPTQQQVQIPKRQSAPPGKLPAERCACVNQVTPKGCSRPLVQRMKHVCCGGYRAPRRLNTSVPLVPPKPKLFFTATLIAASRAVLAQKSRSHSGSWLKILMVGGIFW